MPVKTPSCSCVSAAVFETAEKQGCRGNFGAITGVVWLVCIPSKIELAGPRGRRLDVDFSTGHVSSDGGSLLSQRDGRQAGRASSSRVPPHRRCIAGLQRDRASCHSFRGNALRLWFSMAAQLLVVTIRKVALMDTELSRAQAKTLRNKLFKNGALVSVSVRRIHVRLSSAFPRRVLLALALSRLRAPASLA